MSKSQEIKRNWLVGGHLGDDFMKPKPGEPTGDLPWEQPRPDHVRDEVAKSAKI